MAVSRAKGEVLVGIETRTPTARQWRRVLGPDLDGYGFILPAIIIMTALVLYPFGLAVWFSLSDTLIGEEGRWVGLENFIYIVMEDDIFLQTLRNTLLFAFFSVTLKSSLDQQPRSQDSRPDGREPAHPGPLRIACEE